MDNESYETSRGELVVCRQKYQAGQNFYGQRAVEKRDEKNGNERYTWLRRFAMKMRSFEFQSKLCKANARLSIRGNCTSTGKNWKTLGINVPFDILCWPFEPMVPRITVFSLARSSPKMRQRRRRFVFLKTIKLHCCPRLSRNTFRLTLGWKLSLE